MRLATVLLLSFLAVPVLAQGAWEVLPTSPQAGSSIYTRFEDLEAPTPDSLWVIHIRGELYRSTDGGASWALTDSVENGGFRSLAFINGRVGWVGTLAGAQRVLYETRDSGLTLTNISDRITGDPPSGICGLFVLDEQAIYGVGGIAGGSHFVRTLDGGQTWTSTDMSALASTLIDVYFFDRQRGIAVGDRFGDGGPSSSSSVVLGTEDGGQTWTERFRGPTGASELGWKISFPTPEVGYVSVEYFGAADGEGKVLKTVDGGLTWTEVPVPDAYTMQGIGFVSPQIGWVGGRGNPQMTTDGGLSWSPAPDIRESTNRFVFFGDTLGYAAADRVLRYRVGATPAEPPPPQTEPLAAAPYPNPFPERALFPYYLPEPAEVTLEVFDVLGRAVAEVHHGMRPAGPDELLWRALDAAGRPLPAGAYVYRLWLGSHTASGTLTKQR